MSKPDNTQELDYTHPDEMPTVEHRPSPSSDLRGRIVHFTSEMLDNPNDYGIYPTTNFYNDLEEAILDWHNKQLEEVLDRLEARLTEEASGIRQIKTDYAYGFTARLDKILDQLMKDAITNRRADDPPQGRKMLLSEAKQAITSLIKELVAEAKPTNYTPKGHHPDACLNHEKYTSACCGCQKQRARLQEIDEFEQNLLKALEEE